MGKNEISFDDWNKILEQLEEKEKDYLLAYIADRLEEFLVNKREL